MANRTVRDAASVKGTNPQYLIEKIIRTRIYESKYWKEECFALTAELIVDKGMELKYIGGVYAGNVKVSPFLCLILKMLQIQPEKDIVVEFITQPDFKYVRALGAMYMRLTGNSLDCYKYLEPLYLDYRKLKRMDREGNFDIIYMDEFIDELLREERVFDSILPRIQKRSILENANELEPRTSALVDEEDLEDGDMSDIEEEIKNKYEYHRKQPSSPRHSPHRRRNSKDRDRKKNREDKHRDRDNDRERERKEHRRSRSKDKYSTKDKDRRRDEDGHKSKKSRHHD